MVSNESTTIICLPLYIDTFESIVQCLDKNSICGGKSLTELCRQDFNTVALNNNGRWSCMYINLHNTVSTTLYVYTCTSASLSFFFLITSFLRMCSCWFVSASSRWMQNHVTIFSNSLASFSMLFACSCSCCLCFTTVT